MKELSIGEKAKAYDKALDRAKEWLNIKEPFSDTCTCVVESIFPELKESEDEKKINNLIDELKCSLKAANCQNDACGGGHEKRIALLEWGITWLEKQGNNNNPNWEPSKEQISALEHFVRSIGESGYASPYDGNTKLLYSLLHDLEQLEKQGAQKQEWSEEDEKMIESAIQLAHEYGRHDLWFWLKSLYLEKKPQGKSVLEATNNINDKGYCCVVSKDARSRL